MGEVVDGWWRVEWSGEWRVGEDVGGRVMDDGWISGG